MRREISVLRHDSDRSSKKRVISEKGQSRRFDRPPITSGGTRLTDIFGVRRHVSNVPSIDVIASEFRSPGLGAAAVDVLRSIRPPGPSNHPVSKRNANLPGVGN
jgi:hypothetical protein